MELIRIIFRYWIGNICFNKFHNQLLLTNLEDGKIYRYFREFSLLLIHSIYTMDKMVCLLEKMKIWAINTFGTTEDNGSIPSRIGSSTSNAK